MFKKIHLWLMLLSILAIPYSAQAATSIAMLSLDLINPTTPQLWAPYKFEKEANFVSINRYFTNTARDNTLDIYANSQSWALNLHEEFADDRFNVKLFVENSLSDIRAENRSKDERLTLEQRNQKTFIDTSFKVNSRNHTLSSGFGFRHDSNTHKASYFVTLADAFTIGIGQKNSFNQYKLVYQNQNLTIDPNIQSRIVPREIYILEADFQPEHKYSTLAIAEINLGQLKVQTELAQQDQRFSLQGKSKRVDYTLFYQNNHINLINNLQLNNNSVSDDVTLNQTYNQWYLSVFQAGTEFYRAGLSYHQQHYQADFDSFINLSGELLPPQNVFQSIQNILLTNGQVSFATDLFSQRLNLHHIWENDTRTWHLQTGVGRAKTDAQIRVEYFGPTGSLENRLEVEEVVFATLNLSWQRQWQNWGVRYELGQIIPLHIQERSKTGAPQGEPGEPTDSQGTPTRKKDSKNFSDQAGELLRDWPSGHRQQISIFFYF